MAIGIYISIITLNVNGLNAPTKRHRLAEWVKKPKSTYMLSTRNPLQISSCIQIESERMEKYIPCNGKQKKAGVATLISDKIDLKIKKITRNKEGHYIMIKGSTQEEDITIVNIYAPNIEAPQYIRQTLTDIKEKLTVTQ